ncbi:hypothetical protein DL764_008792 [Monosporascus ibericus]|uniref:Ketoreductase domain-containing protein n=1 Tax=Monosporascus ibericus TaxID=155417 RepID=A0A4Q4SYV4_9PEZI|nr:hypothetical protein DL764_008792 [Monosporascus ibericus]
MMLRIQESKIQREKSLDFICRLECLRLTDNEFGSPTDAVVRPDFSRERIDAFQNGEYMALSYTWECAESESGQCGGYLVETRNGNIELSNVRDVVFDRAIAYMCFADVEYLWIDRECIVQERGEEKETAIHAMDLVYQRSSHPVALLAKRIETEDELYLLAQLLEGNLTYRNEQDGTFLLRPRQTRTGAEALKLLEAITSDRWWTRAWTFQENYRGGTRMRLLIPHADHLECRKADYAEVFGGLPGELDINSAQFHEAATMLCLAFEPRTDSEEEVVENVLSRAGRYSLLLQEPDQNGEDVALRSMSPIVFANIEDRVLTDHWDRLAIVANCCQYRVRLDSTKLERQGYSVSVSMLALLFLNGEILHNAPDREPCDAPSPLRDLTAAGFLREQAFDEFYPPFSERGLTFNKGCRFFDTTLTRDGICTHGHLWRLHQIVKTRDLPCWRPRDGDMEDALWKLKDCIWRRGEHELADELRNYLNLERERGQRNGTRSQSLANRYMRAMANELACAVYDGRDLRLGYLWDPSAESSPSRGIFICHDEDEENDPSGFRSGWSARQAYVFTAFRPMATSDSSGYCNDVDRHISLEVDAVTRNGLPPRLYARMNILEIGAGTGSATAAALRHLRSNFDIYTFTDISSGFFGKAQGTFAEYDTRMQFEVLDIGRSPAEQGVMKYSYDLVIASSVLHATKSLSVTIRDCRRLIRPGGYLVVEEGTSDTLRIPFIFCGLQGWWVGTDDGRKHQPTVSEAKWDSLLRTNQFSGVDQKVDVLRDPLTMAPGLVHMEELLIIGQVNSAFRVGVANALPGSPTQDDILWSNETELAMEDDHLYIPRVVSDDSLSERFNSGRRPIQRNVSAIEESTTVVNRGNSLVLEAADLDKGPVSRNIRTIRVHSSSLCAFTTIDDSPTFYLCLGIVLETNQRVLAVSAANASSVKVPFDQTFNWQNGKDSDEILEEVLTVLLCESYTVGVNGTVWIHNPSDHLLNAPVSWNPAMPLSIDSSKMRDILQDYHSRANMCSTLQSAGNQVPIAAGKLYQLQEISSCTDVIWWANIESIPVRLSPLKVHRLFSDHKKYFLVGLTGELGLSFCEWMTEHGAKNFAIASWNPSIHSGILKHLQNKGANIKAFPLDITDKQSLQEVHRQILESMPPIAGVVNGAMVIRDKPFYNLSLDDFESVLKPKVDESRYLYYSAAKMFMAGLARQRRWSGLAVSVMNIGMVIGCGYLNQTSHEKDGHEQRKGVDHLLRMGYAPLSEPEFHTLFAEAVHSGQPELGLDPELITDIGETDATWTRSPRLSHYRIRTQRTAASHGTTKSTQGVHGQLAEARDRRGMSQLSDETAAAYSG